MNIALACCMAWKLNKLNQGFTFLWELSMGTFLMKKELRDMVGAALHMQGYIWVLKSSVLSWFSLDFRFNPVKFQRFHKPWEICKWLWPSPVLATCSETTGVVGFGGGVGINGSRNWQKNICPSLHNCFWSCFGKVCSSIHVRERCELSGQRGQYTPRLKPANEAKANQPSYVFNAFFGCFLSAPFLFICEPAHGCWVNADKC